MDVSQGLMKKFVKCKSIQRALSPISSQISLLIIIVEQHQNIPQNGSSDAAIPGAGKPVLDAAVCAAQLSEAVAELVRAGEKQSLTWKDEEFVTRMAGACESLTVACNQLSIMAQRFSSGITPPSAVKSSLCQAAKDVLHGVLKIFLVIDDFQVQQVIKKVDFVEGAVSDVASAQKSQLIQAFKALTFSVLALKTELKKRCSNLLSHACQEQLLVWLGVLQNSVPSLSVATQTRLKYRENLDAKASQESVEHEMKEACKKIRQLLRAGPQEEMDDELISFVGLVDNVMDALSEDNRKVLTPDLECDLVALVQHSMGVAHLATQGSHRDLVVGCCHRILQAKFRLLDLHGTSKNGQILAPIRVDFDNTCETLLDEICDLELQVNMTLLQLIIETFLSPEDELRPLRKIARKQEGNGQQDHVAIINKFTEFSENLCRVSLLVAASSTDTAKVREILTSVRCLESIEAEIGPAVLLTATRPSTSDSDNKGAAGGHHQHLGLLLDWWSREVRGVLAAVDTVVDPRVFMDMTENMIGEELESVRDLIGGEREELCVCFYRLRHLAQRPVELARRLQDESSDAIYRNGLGVFIQLLVQRINEATQAFQEAVTQMSESEREMHISPRLLDTLHRRLCLVQRAVGTLRDGLNIRTHPELMSEHRRTLFAHRPVEVVHEHIKIKKEKEDNREKAAAAKAEDLRQRKRMEKETNKVNDATNSKMDNASYTAEANIEKAILLPKPSKENVEMSLKFPSKFEEKEQEGGHASEIYGLVRKLVTCCARQDQRSVEQLTHGVLSWTNHIVENAGILLSHCPHIAKESDLRELIKEVDKLAPEVIQRARFVSAGETEAVYSLMSEAVLWSNKLNSARVITDVAADRWLVLTSDLRRLSVGQDQQKLKLAVSSVTNAQKEMTSLLLKTRFLSGHFLPEGQQQIQFLIDSHSEIENLAITIKTAIDVAAIMDPSTDQSWWQLSMACREWAVLMTSVTAVLDNIADTMGSLVAQRMPSLAQLQTSKSGVGQNRGPELKGLRLADVAERETDTLLELVDCVVAGDTTLKSQSEELVQELQEALTDIFSVAKQPVAPSETSLHALLCRLRIGLAKSRWLEKALDIQDSIRSNCYQYMGFARTLLLDAQDLSYKEESEGSAKVSDARHQVSVHFLETSSALKHRVLRAIQLCPDLNKRAVVRSTLDNLAKLTTQIGDVMRAPGTIPDAKVYSYSDQWGARMKKLLVNLGKMDGVKPSFLTELEKFNKVGTGSGHIPRVATAQQNTHMTTSFEQYHYPHQKPQYHPHGQEQGQLQNSYINGNVGSQLNPSSYPKRVNPSSNNDQHKVFAGEQQQPMIPPKYARQQYHNTSAPRQHNVHWLNHPRLSDQPRHMQLWQEHNNSSPQQYQFQPPYTRQQQAASLQGAKHGSNINGDPMNEMPSTLTNPIQIVLKDAEYLGLCLKRWRGDGVRHLKSVQAALEMARLCSEMALYTRGQGNFNSSLQVSEAAANVVLQSRDVEAFGQALLGLAGRGRMRDHVQVCNNKIQSCSSQLHIIATALHNSAQSHEGDLILVRNASNLLTAVRQLFSVVEGVAARKPDHSVAMMASDPLTEEVVTLLSTLRAENDRYLAEERSTGPVDILGLRRVELHRPPSLASLLDGDLGDGKGEEGIAGKTNREDQSQSRQKLNDVKDQTKLLSHEDEEHKDEFSIASKTSPNKERSQSFNKNADTNDIERNDMNNEQDQYYKNGELIGKTNNVSKIQSRASINGGRSANTTSTATSPIYFDDVSADASPDVFYRPLDDKSIDQTNKMSGKNKEDMSHYNSKTEGVLEPYNSNDSIYPRQVDQSPFAGVQNSVQTTNKTPERKGTAGDTQKNTNIDRSFEKRKVDQSVDISNEVENTLKKSTKLKQSSADTQASSEIEEERIEKVMSPSSELDVEKLLHDLDEAIEVGGGGLGSPIKSPPTSGIVSPVTVDPNSMATSKSQPSGTDSLDNKEERIKGKETYNQAGTTDKRKDFYDTYIQHNLDSDKEKNENPKFNSKYTKSKEVNATAHKKPFKTQKQNYQSEESNQSEEDVDSLIGGTTSVQSFHLQSEDVFSEPTRKGLTRYRAQESPPGSPTQRLTATKSPDSSSEAGLSRASAKSAKSFILSHEDVFSENKDSWDTHF